MTPPVVALDLTLSRLGNAGPQVYVRQLERALAPLLGERLRHVTSRLAPHPRATRGGAGDRTRTLGRDLWWFQVGVGLAARRAGADLLHLPAGRGPARPALPTVVTIHDVIALRHPEYFRAWPRTYARLVLPRLARAARAVITVSDASKADIVERLGISEDHVTVVPNGVDPVFAPPAADDGHGRALRARLDLPPAFVLAVGAIEPRKNLPRVLEAIALLRSRPGTADIRLVHAGPDGWLADDVGRAMRTAGLADAVRFVGYLPPEDLATLYGLATLCVYPSLWEGFGLPVAEAMACGCPVVTSDVPPLRDVAGGAALLVDPTSAAGIAEAIGSLWRDAGLRRTLASRGVERARTFTWERTARETAAVYDAALR